MNAQIEVDDDSEIEELHSTNEEVSLPAAPSHPEPHWISVEAEAEDLPSSETLWEAEMDALRDCCPMAGMYHGPDNEIIVRLPIDTDHIGCIRSRTWGILTTAPLIVEIAFRASADPDIDALQSTAPDLNVSQLPPCAEPLGVIRFFIKSRAERWWAEHAAGGASVSERLSGTLLRDWFEYLNFRFNTASTYCLVCDCDLETTTVALTVCDRAECQKFYRTASYGSVLCSEVRRSAEVVDLLLNMLVASALRSNPKCYGVPLAGDCAAPKDANVLPAVSAANFGVPYGAAYARPPYAGQHGVQLQPAAFEPYPYGLGFDTGGKQDVRLLLDTVDKVPPIRDLQRFTTDMDLKQHLDLIDPLIFPLLKWLVCSTRTCLCPLPAEDCLPEMNTPYQFKVLNANPEHERRFQEWCDKARAQGTGTYRGFHGSPMANWHSVLRAGLRCSPQGALGPGVYAHETAVYSQGYMGTAPVGVWRNSLFSPDPRAMSMMALVEIADLRHDRKLINHSAGNNAISDYTMVVTRFLFFYPKAEARQLRATASTLVVREDILADVAGGGAAPVRPRDDPNTVRVKNLHTVNQMQNLTCCELKQFIQQHHVHCPSGARKEVLIQSVQQYLQAQSVPAAAP